MMSLAVFTFLPARAEDDTNVSLQLTSAEVAPISVNVDDSLEKIPSPDQLKYFKVMKKENGALYGIRIRTATASGTPTLYASDGSELEKIPSPDQLKYFKVMKKENGALYGIRIHASNAGNTDNEEEDSNTSISDKVANLEKILAPQFIGLYERIQKIGTSLWGVKKSEKSDDDVKVKTQRLVTADMIECVSKAIDTKDTAMIALTKNSAEKITTAISARGTCQKAAIASTENQAQNLKECVVIFQKAHQEIVTEARKAQKDIWGNYTKEMKTCASSSSVVDDNNVELMIDDGGNNTLDLLVE